MFFRKAGCCSFGSTLQQPAPVALPCHRTFGWISHGLVDETITADSGPEAVVWALLLSDSHTHHSPLKVPNKKEKKE